MEHPAETNPFKIDNEFFAPNNIGEWARSLVEVIALNGSLAITDRGMFTFMMRRNAFLADLDIGADARHRGLDTEQKID